MCHIYRWIVVSPSGENVVVELSYLRAMVGLKNVLLDSQSVSQSKRFVVRKLAIKFLYSTGKLVCNDRVLRAQ
jgi:hypothetical protein